MEEFSMNSMENLENSPVDHGWQEVVYPKRQRKPKHENSHPPGGEPLHQNGASDNVFRSVEQRAEERRRRAVEAHKAAIAAAAAAAAEIAVKRPGGSGSSDDSDDSEVDNSLPNGIVEEKPKQKKQKKPRVTIPEAASKIDAGDLSAFLAEVSGLYENAPDIQLVRFADYYARAFSAISASQFPWTKMFKESLVSKIVDVPVSYISEDVYMTSVDWIGQRPAEALGEFMLWALDSIFVELAAHQGSAKSSKKSVQQQPSSKGQVAIFLVLAMVVRRRPEALLGLVQTLKTNPKYQGQEKVPVLVWVIAQASQGDLALGMSLLVQILIPMASSKSSNPQSRDLILQLLERILSSPKARPVLLNGAVRKGERLVPPSAFDLLIHAAFPIPSARIKATERFQAVYPFLKELALAGSPGSRAIKQVAQQLLPITFSAISKNNPELSGEAAEIFIWCLTQSSECYKQWENAHVKNIDASVVVLTKISEEWKQYSTKLRPFDNLRRTLKNLTLKASTSTPFLNEQALNGGESDADCIASIRLTDKLCKALLAKVASRGSCAKASILMITVGVTIYAVASTNLDSWDWKKLPLLFGTPQGL
ncbi:Transmembrane protein [Nymphaea thermarum]|nr:Transmembrane protein [Nymphaea thermarum]